MTGKARRPYRALTAALFLGLMAPSLAAAQTAPKPLYRDPVLDGAADVSIVWDRAAHLWTMFYTNRRATLRLPDPADVAWVHATPIGVATSADGVTWRYKGTATFPQACTGVTLWAPELFHEQGVYHLWLTIVPGVHHRWGEPGATTKIVHLTSADLSDWTCGETLDLGSDLVIDASVVRLKDRYRLYYRDSRPKTHLKAVDSQDLKTWTPTPEGDITKGAAEGPKVFRFKGRWWLIADVWKGLLVLQSKDGLHWTEQAERLLQAPGVQPTDRGIGQHPDVVVSGGRAFIYYFVHQGAEPEAKDDPYWKQRTVIQVAELKVVGDRLTVDRDAPVKFRLQPPRR